jgi:hypothetical protein
LMTATLTLPLLAQIPTQSLLKLSIDETINYLYLV